MKMKILGAYEHQKTQDIYCYLGIFEGKELFWNDSSANYEFVSPNELMFQDEIWDDTPALPIFPMNINVGDEVRLKNGDLATIIAIMPILHPYVEDFKFVVSNGEHLYTEVGSLDLPDKPTINWNKILIDE